MSFNCNGNIPKEIFFNNQEVKKLIYNGNVVWKKIRLPRLYTEVEYIESSGTQYIDTGVTGTQNTKVDIEFQATGANFLPFGARSGASNACFAIWAASSSVGSNLRIGFANSAGYTGGPTTRNKYHIIHSKDGTYVNNNLVWSIGSFSTFTTPQNLLVFGYYNTPTTRSLSAIRLYHLKLWENNIMVRDFIPCYRNSDGEIGLYDSINDIFYTNQGTGVFIKGKDVYTLPNEYQEVEYIESSGTQYIRTDIVPTDFFKMELKFYAKATSSFYCAGARNLSSSVFYFAQSGASAGRKISAVVNGTSVVANTNGSDWMRSTTGATYEIRLSTNGDGTFSYNIKDLTENKEFLSENNSYSTMGTVTDKVFLFALNSSNKLSGTNRCYYFKLYEENELIFYGIPCYRKSDNEAGLYDIVTNTFLTNQGTGVFIKGKDVYTLPNEYQEVEYIESSETQWIDTGVIPDNRTGISMKLSINDINSDKIRIGCRETSGDTRFWIGTTRRVAYFGFGKNYGTGNDDFKIQSNIPFIAYLNYKNNRTCYVDDYTPLSLGSVSSITFTRSIIMFGRNYPSGITGSAQKVYSCQISQDNELIRYFIPCYRKSDNKPGMYDLVNDVFYTNAGTGEFIIGDNI